jgi:hypothetical protein
MRLVVRLCAILTSLAIAESPIQKFLRRSNTLRFCG